VAPYAILIFMLYSILFFRKNCLNKYYIKRWASNRLLPFIVTLVFSAGYINFANCYFGDDEKFLISDAVISKYCGPGGRYGSVYNISFYSSKLERDVKMDVHQHVCHASKIGEPANIYVQQGLFGVLFYKI
jgi:hypothetical protein